jgi:hypothetical protein
VLSGVTSRQIGASSSALADEEEVTREKPIAEPHAEAVLRVAGRVQELELDLAEAHAIAVLHTPIGARARRQPVHDVVDSRSISKRRSAGDVIGMDVCVEDCDEAQASFRESSEVALDVLENGVDEHGLVRRRGADQVRLARSAVELFEDHLEAV